MDVVKENDDLSIISKISKDLISDDESSNCSSLINNNEYKCSEEYEFFYNLIPHNALCNGNYPGIIPDELKDLTLFEKSSLAIYNPMTKIMMRGFDRFPYHKGKIYTIINNMVESSDFIPKQINYINTTIINSHNEKYDNKQSLLKFKNKYLRPEKLRNGTNILKKYNCLYQDKIKINYKGFNLLLFFFLFIFFLFLLFLFYFIFFYNR